MILARDSDTRITNWRFLAVTFASVFALLGCNRIPAEYRVFLELPISEQHKVMRDLPIDKRIDYYLAGMTYVAPPEISLADDIAQEGKQALPALMKKLRDSKSESDQDHIIYVFRVMHARYYKLNGEIDALHLLRETVDSMKDPGHKENGEITLRFIHTNQLPELEKMLDNNSVNS